MRLDWTLFMLSSFWMVVGGFAPKSWFKRQLQPFCGKACLLTEVSNPLLCFCWRKALQWHGQADFVKATTQPWRPFGKLAGLLGAGQLTQLRRAVRKTWRKSRVERCLELSLWVTVSHGLDELRMESLQVTSALRRLCLTTRSWTLDTQLQNPSKGPEFDLSSNKLRHYFFNILKPCRCWNMTWTSSFAIRCGSWDLWLRTFSAHGRSWRGPDPDQSDCWCSPISAGDMRHTHYLHLSMPLCPMPVICYWFMNFDNFCMFLQCWTEKCLERLLS